MTGKWTIPVPCYGALLAQASQHLWLVAFHDVYRAFTCVHHTANPVPSPPDAGRYTVPSRFGCQSGDCGSVVRGLLTACYLAAVPRRILLMAQQVWSVQHARQSTLRPRVADPLKAGQFPSFNDLAQRRVFVAETEAKRRCGIKPFQKGPETTA